MSINCVKLKASLIFHDLFYDFFFVLRLKIKHKSQLEWVFSFEIYDPGGKIDNNVYFIDVILFIHFKQ